jgi:hypothetical protein
MNTDFENSQKGINPSLDVFGYTCVFYEVKLLSSKYVEVCMYEQLYIFRKNYIFFVFEYHRNFLTHCSELQYGSACFMIIFLTDKYGERKIL